MADKQANGLTGRKAKTGHRLRIRADLESKGVSQLFSRSVAERLAPIAARLTREEYVAALDAVSVAYDVQCAEQEAQRRDGREIEEIQRLMRGFAGELRKLEEGLKILSAYSLRMRSRAVSDSSGTLH